MAIGANPDPATVAQITAQATTAAAKIMAQAQAGNASIAAAAAVVAALVTCAAAIYGARKNARTSLRIFAGEQRALGEALIDPANASTCIGYGAFLVAFPPRTNALVDALRKDLEALARDATPARQRLGELQHALIDLLNLLDPDSLRFPTHSRSRV